MWDIIEAAGRGLLPDKIMLNTHPQRWDDRFGPWMKELVWQNVKNVIKRYMIKLRAQWNSPSDVRKAEFHGVNPSEIETKRHLTG